MGSITHGMSSTKIYGVWKGIRKRCNNKNSGNYKWYGGKGVECEWDSFQDFYDDMGESYIHGLWIERIDSKGNYCKKNCRRATRKEQFNNRSSNRIISYEGRDYTMMQLSEHIGVEYFKLKTRLNEGRTFEDIISIGDGREGSKYQGKTISERSKYLNVSRTMFYNRINKGQSLEGIVTYYKEKQ